MSAESIGCPVSWCCGAREQHGGDGDPPWHWLHMDARPALLPYGATLTRFREGAGPVTWHLAVDPESLAELEASELAARLRRLAEEVELRTATVSAGTGCP